MNHVRPYAAAFMCCMLAMISMAPASEAKDVQAKPGFQLHDVDGVVRRLSDYRGKWVVLEWINFACPSVTEQYQATTRKMQTLQRTFMAKGVVWLTINSAATGQQGHMSAKQNKAALAKLGATPTAFLLDPAGIAGKTFGAVVTPEVRVISPQGNVVYAGGVESAGKTTRTPYLQQVLNSASSGRAIPFAVKAAQGCLIKYAAANAPATSGVPLPNSAAPKAAGPQAPKAAGPQAPNFALTDSNGVARRLSDYRGKWVILEWVNYDCPFVQKHYNAAHRSMQTLQARAARAGIVWLSICSSSRGKQGHFSSAQANARMRQMGAKPTAYLHDPTGGVGRAYGAKTTPGMRIISPQGVLVYSGGIDSIRSARASDVAKAKNYIALAIADILARRPIAIKRSRSYGCSVKY